VRLLSVRTGVCKRNAAASARTAGVELGRTRIKRMLKGVKRSDVGRSRRG